MLKRLLMASAALCLALSAWAQSSPPWNPGALPTDQNWKAFWAGKQDLMTPAGSYNWSGLWTFNGGVNASNVNVGADLATLSNAGGPGSGRLTLCNNYTSPANCAYLSAYDYTTAPQAGPLSLQLTGDCVHPGTGISTFQLSDAADDSRFEFWVCGPSSTPPTGNSIDNYLIGGSPGVLGAVYGSDFKIATQWDPYSNGGSGGAGQGGPRSFFIGLGSSTSVLPAVPGLAIVPLMSGQTVQAARVGIGTATAPQGALHVASPEVNSHNQVIFDGQASSSGMNLELIGDGVTTPNKYIQSHSGNLAFANSAFTNVMAYISDGGAIFGGNSATVGVGLSLQNTVGTCTFTATASGSSTQSCSSDRRLKKDIRDAADEIPWLKSFRIRDYTVRSNGAPGTSPVAQEVQRAHPEMVTRGVNGFLQLEAPSPWKMMKVMQEQQAEIEELRFQIHSLMASSARH